MSRIFSTLIIVCFCVSAFYEWGYIWWNLLLELPAEMFDAYDLAGKIIISVLACLLWIEIGLSKLCYKSVAFIFFLDSLWTIAQFFADGSMQNSYRLLNGLIFVPWLAWAYFRSYQLKSSAILPDRVYFISGKPKNIGSFYLSLFGDPSGSKGVYIDGKLYGYHHGKFVSRALEHERMDVIAIEIKNANNIEEYLRTMIGTDYSLMNNCLITRLRVWWHVQQNTLR